MTPILFGMLLSILVSIIILVTAIQKRNATKSHYFIILSIFIALYNVGRTFEAVASGLEAAYNGVILAYFGSPYIPVTLLFFLLDYYNIKIKRRPLLVLLLPSFLTTIIVTIPSLRSCYYRDYSFFPGPPIGQVMVAGTTLYYILSGYYLMLLLICLALSLWGAVKLNKTERWSSLTVFFALALPLLVEFLYVMNLTQLKLDLVPIALCFSLSLLGMAVYRLNLLRIVPMVKDVILEQMSDAFIIVDHENRYVESNVTAKKQFPILSGIRVGQKMTLSDLFPNMTEGLDGRTLVSIISNGIQQYYHLTETPIKQNDKKLCTCYTLHDVTDTRKLMVELKAMATYDSLTQIYNRASFYQLAAHEFDLARAQNTPLTAFAIDIDHFKEINDAHGHFCGDEIIKSIVNKISGRLRTADIFGRVGGDEFNVLLPNTNLESAIALARNLQNIVNTSPYTYDSQQVFATISIGISELDDQRHTNLEHLLMDVDNALYKSKNMGRNKVCIYRAIK